MTLEQIEAQVSQLPPEDLKAFSAWFEEFVAEAWDRQMESDATTGGLDRLAENLGVSYAAGDAPPMAEGWRRWQDRQPGR